MNKPSHRDWILYRAYSSMISGDSHLAKEFYQTFQVEIELCRSYIMTPGVLEKVMDDIRKDVQERKTQVRNKQDE